MCEQCEQEVAQHTALLGAGAEGDGGGGDVLDPHSLSGRKSRTQLHRVEQWRIGKLCYKRKIAKD